MSVEWIISTLLDTFSLGLTRLRFTNQNLTGKLQFSPRGRVRKPLQNSTFRTEVSDDRAFSFVQYQYHPMYLGKLV